MRGPVLFLISIGLSGCALRDSIHAKSRLDYVLDENEERGELYDQARLSGFDYRAHLAKAINADSTALKEIFVFTAEQHLCGVAQDENCEVLFQLMHLWKDVPYANVLRQCPRGVRAFVVGEISYCFPYPGWKRDQFPVTFSLGNHDQ
jgi:hypothetical protein